MATLVTVMRFKNGQIRFWITKSFTRLQFIENETIPRIIVHEYARIFIRTHIRPIYVCGRSYEYSLICIQHETRRSLPKRSNV